VDEAYALVVSIAAGRIDVPDLAAVLESHLA
jgi:hypothetical protein